MRYAFVVGCIFAQHVSPLNELRPRSLSRATLLEPLFIAQLSHSLGLPIEGVDTYGQVLEYAWRSDDTTMNALLPSLFAAAVSAALSALAAIVTSARIPVDGMDVLGATAVEALGVVLQRGAATAAPD